MADDATAARDAPRVVAIGDSLTWGYPDGPQASWVWHVAEALGINVRNLGVNGDTLADIRARIPAVLALRPRCCLVSGGTNDATLGRGPEAMGRDTAAMVDALREAGIFPIIGTPPPYGDPVCEKALAAYRHLVNAFAGTRRVRVIPFERAFLGPDGRPDRALFVDATHPSRAGYEAMARLVVEGGALSDFAAAADA